MAFIGNQPTAVPLTSSQLTDGLITTGKIADGAVENVDIASNTINLTQKVTGTLPFANGGTGLSTLGTAGQALIVNSSATALSYATIGGGKVLQVVSGTTTTQVTTGSTSYQSTGIAVSITPSLASSKIFIIFTTTFETNTNNSRATYGIFRDSTQITLNAVQQPNTAGSPYYTGSANFLDSPNTTSAISYNVKFKTDANTCGVNFPSGNGTITCFEIGA